jgi:succinyl-diaminopimelate desuccinylase
MPTPLECIERWIEGHKEEMLSNLQALLRIPSVESDPKPNAPFGQPVRDALDFTLNLGKQWGMCTKDLEGYIGFAEFGSGEKLVVTLGHLDVVPVGSGWKFDPFGAEIHEGYLYARGAVDDKGPTIASFYAARAIQQCVPDIPARIRCVFGCNEESGFKCLQHYLETEEIPTYGIAPDSDWPAYHAEKGIALLYVSAPRLKGDLELIEIHGGERSNIVMDTCRATLRVSSQAKHEVEEKLSKAWDKNITWDWGGDLLNITSIGKSAHAMDPHKGDSAAIRMFRFLYEIAPLSAQESYEKLLNIAHIGGAGLGITGADKISYLTSNLGVISTEKDIITMLFNIRYPVTWTWAEVERRCRAFLAEHYPSFRITKTNDSPPLYIPEDHPLVKTISEVYKEQTGIQLKPGINSGGTYARAIPNTVSIGTGWEGDGNIHSADECLKVDHLFKMCRIYAHILYRLAYLNEIK